MSEKQIYKKYALHNFKKKNEEEKLNAVLLSLQIQICGEEKLCSLYKGSKKYLIKEFMLIIQVAIIICPYLRVKKKCTNYNKWVIQEYT